MFTFTVVVGGIKLSNKNMTGEIPSDLTKLTGLVELWLDGNSLTGQIPDFSKCTNLKIIHLENNRLIGKIPSPLAKLPNLTEVYLQNNMLSGTIPSRLKNVYSNLTGNLNLKEREDKRKKLGVIIGASFGASVLLIATIFSCIWLCKANKNSKRKTSAELTNRPLHVQRVSSTLSDAHGDAAQCFTLYEIEEATKKFEKRIGSGGFGIVYYGKTREGKEIAVKVLGNNSFQGKKEFANEVTLLSRIHHRNLVQFLGYCEEEGRNMLVYLQNNMLSGTIPSRLKNVYSNLTGNLNLKEREDKRKKLGVIIGASFGASVLLIATIFSCIWLCKANKNSKRKTSAELTNRPLHVQRVSSTLSDAHGDAAQCFTLYEIEEATKKFEKRIGSGGFGIVYYGKTREGKEIAVKVLGNNSFQGKKEFANEVTLLSRIHHRNLVQFLGYCEEEGRNMLVYEFMHNGTLKEHLYSVVSRERRISWIKRLEIAEDAARGIEYLHTGCVPAIIHRDLKTSNILLDKHMRAKVSDFGLSKFAVDGASHVSSIVRGTVGYLDPEYYISQQLTEKSDVYSFGVILLELISGQEAISNENFGANCRNIVQWAKMHIENGDIRGIIDPALAEDDYSLQSMWKIAEKALLCVRPHGNMRPSMSEVQKDIQDAIRIEKEALAARGGLSDEFSRSSAHSSSLNMGMHDLAGSQNFVAIDESVLQPKAR
ncbi:hypothetical protein F2Q70_00024941 [Brassica cretica]|uniref:Protein kinase domain-containing protein n=1 Tax=Brassica cretica TaxID=69181 RepID=A0A8S9LB27_BRACR|nr:hypothetical protein F2Q70_00024941 [Brassica cretica]